MSATISRLRSSLLAFSAAASLWACGAGTDGPSSEVVAGRATSVPSSEGLAVGTVRLDGAQITRGPNAFLVGFDPAETEVVAATTFMPAHGHGSVTPSLARQADGYRISEVVFSMPGLWEVRLDLVVGGKPDHLVFNADAP
jgi:hypothetical protein